MQTIAPPNRQSLEIISPRALQALLGLNAVTIWRMRRARQFPEPIRLSPGRCGWRRVDIEAWLAERAAASGGSEAA